MRQGNASMRVNPAPIKRRTRPSIWAGHPAYGVRRSVHAPRARGADRAAGGLTSRRAGVRAARDPDVV